MTPALKLMRYELKKQDVPPAITQRLINVFVDHVRRFSAAGGQILFGTDVGYMDDFDPTEEYQLLSKAGLTPMQILASLTTTDGTKAVKTNRMNR